LASIKLNSHDSSLALVSAGYYYAERRIGAFTRVIPLQSEVDVKKASAKYKNGLLRVVLPKASHANARRIEVASAQ
jgi:HSP20 family protein